MDSGLAGTGFQPSRGRFHLFGDASATFREPAKVVGDSLKVFERLSSNWGKAPNVFGELPTWCGTL